MSPASAHRVVSARIAYSFLDSAGEVYGIRVRQREAA